MDRCDICVNNVTDEEGEQYCARGGYMDEDDYYRLMQHPDAPCPFFEPGDEYKIVRRQN